MSKIEEVKSSNLERLQQMLLEEQNKEKEQKLTKEEAERIESVIFEDDATVKLRDGKEYKIPPCSLKDARLVMKLLPKINLDMVAVNFYYTGNEEQDEERINTLYTLLEIAFKHYPEIDRDYLDKYVDVKTAAEIIAILIDISGIKK